MMRYVRELLVFASIGIAAAAGTYLVRQNRTLAEQNRLLARRAVEPRPGLFVPAAQAATLDGDSVILGQVGQGQLLFFFNHTCPYCRASVPAWNTIAQRLDGEAIPLYGVALDSASVAEAYAAEQGLRFPVIAKPEPRLVALYRVSGVPLVLLLNQDGRMAYARLGVLESPAAIDSVVAAARASLASSTGEEGS
jgi:peroxiredoxin